MDLSAENVELVKSVYQAVNDNDLDTFLGLMHSDVELTTSGVYPDFSPTYRGREGALSYWEAARGVWDNFSVEIKRMEAVGDRVLVLLHQTVEGRDGIVVEHDWGHLFAFADERIRHVTGFVSWEAAIQEAGAESVVRGG
jgi:ketosteroid isomerase-like protein